MSPPLQLQSMTQVDCHQVFTQIVNKSQKVGTQLTTYGSLRVGDEFFTLKGKQEKRVRIARPPKVDLKYDRVVLYLQSNRIESDLSSLTRATFQASRFVEIMPDRQIITRCQLKQEVVDLVVKCFPPGSKRQHIKAIYEQLQQESEVRIFYTNVEEACIYLSKRGYMHYRKGTYRPILPPVWGVPVEREYKTPIITSRRLKQKGQRTVTKIGWVISARAEIPDTFDKRPNFYYTIQFLDGTITEENEKDLEAASNIQSIYAVRLEQKRLSSIQPSALKAECDYSVEAVQALIDQIHLPNGRLNRRIIAEIARKIGLKISNEKRQNRVIDFLDENFPNWRDKSHNICQIGITATRTSSSEIACQV